MSSSTIAPARRRGLRSRLAALITTLALGAAGLLTLAGPVHADSVVQITDSADPVQVNTSYTYTATAPDVPNWNVIFVNLSGADATITDITSPTPGVNCGHNTFQSNCTRQGAPSTSVTVIVTVTPNAAGTVTASTEVRDFGDAVLGTDSEDTTIGAPYTFTGFFAPVNNPPVVNTVNAGRSIPVKFALGGDQGLDVLADGSPYSQATTCGTGTQDPVETTTNSNSGLTYDSRSGRYAYVWKTDGAWAGTCRTFHLKLADGTDHTALFQFH